MEREYKTHKKREGEQNRKKRLSLARSLALCLVRSHSRVRSPTPYLSLFIYLFFLSLSLSCFPGKYIRNPRAYRRSPIRRYALFCVSGSPFLTLPSRCKPFDFSSWPESEFRSVVLPLPDGPMMAAEFTNISSCEVLREKTCAQDFNVMA